MLYRGFSLIEMLVVVGIFSILAVVATQVLSSSLRGSRKSENIGRVRENVEYALNYIERNLRAAKGLDFEISVNDSSICPSSGDYMYFYNGSGMIDNFRKDGTRLMHGSYAITNSDIEITNVEFKCVQGFGGSPDSVSITIEAKDASTTGVAESAVYRTSTTISLRNYSRN